MESQLLSPYITFIKLFVTLQFVAVIAAAIYSLLFVNIRDFLQRRKIRMRDALKNLLRQHITDKTMPTIKATREYSYLIEAIYDIDRETKDSYWNQIKDHLCRSILFPYARKLVYSRHWSRRLQASRCFLLYIDPSNEEYVLHLLRHDNTPLVKCAASYCAARIGTRNCALAIIAEMDKSDRFLRHPYVNSVLGVDTQFFTYVEEVLAQAEHPYTRVSCYELLAHHVNPRIVKFAENDLHASHKNLRVVAIRTLGRFPHTDIHPLLPLLQDPDWEVRAITASVLGKLGANETSKDIAPLLGDKTWWVRLNAAVALKKMGSVGKEILQSQDPNKDRYAYEMAQYVLPLDVEVRSHA